MIERRATSRARIDKSGKIIVSDNAPKIECTVSDLSVDGASLKVSSTLVVPARFDLVIDNSRHTCRVVWINETQVGVMFV
jgi:hypothetical protein